MALSTTTLASPVGATIYIDSDANSTVEVASSSGREGFQLYINNLGNGDPCYVQMVDATSATSGSTDSTNRFYCPGDSTISYVIPTALLFGSGVCIWATAAGTVVSNNVATATTGKAITDTTSPVNAVEIRFHTS